MSEIITPTEQLTVQDHFAPFEAQAKQWLEKANQIKVTDESQVDLMKEARIARLALSKVRIGIENTRVELKEEYLRKGNAIQEVANRLRDMIKPIEAILQEQEDFAEVQKAKRKRELFNARLLELKPLIGKEAELFPLGDMQQQAFENMLLGYKVAQEQKEKAEIEERERVAKEKLEREAEDKRIREENELLQQQNKKIETRLNRISAIGLIWNEELQSHCAKHDNTLRLMGYKTISDAGFDTCIEIISRSISKHQEKEKKEKEKLQFKLDSEKAERKRLEDEAKAKADKEESDRKEKLAAERKLKRGPGKANLEKLVRDISLLDCYPSKEPEIQKIIDNAFELLKKVQKYIQENISKL